MAIYVTADRTPGHLLSECERKCNGDSKKLDNYNILLENFLTAFYDSGKSDSENWTKLFCSINTWKTKYMVSSDHYTLYGVFGWYLNLFYCKFIADEAKDYLPVLSFINWSMDFADGDYEFYKNQRFFDTLLCEVLPKENSLTEFTRNRFLEELSDQYQKSHKRFEHYVNAKDVSTNPKVIEKLTPEYPRFMKFLDGLKRDLPECRIFRINDLGEDGNVWYFIEEKEYTHIILLQDFA